VFIYIPINIAFNYVIPTIILVIGFLFELVNIVHNLNTGVFNKGNLYYIIQIDIGYLIMNKSHI